jgi:hypothetical protein
MTLDVDEADVVVPPHFCHHRHGSSDDVHVTTLVRAVQLPSTTLTTFTESNMKAYMFSAGRGSISSSPSAIPVTLAVMLVQRVQPIDQTDVGSAKTGPYMFNM